MIAMFDNFTPDGLFSLAGLSPRGAALDGDNRRVGSLR